MLRSVVVSPPLLVPTRKPGARTEFRVSIFHERASGRTAKAGGAPLPAGVAVRRRVARVMRHLVVGHPLLRVGLRLEQDLHLSPLDRQELGAALEQEFGLELPDNEIAGWQTVGDVHRSVRRAMTL